MLTCTRRAPQIVGGLGDVAAAFDDRAPVVLAVGEVHDRGRLPRADLLDHPLALTNVDHRSTAARTAPSPRLRRRCRGADRGSPTPPVMSMNRLRRGDQRTLASLRGTVAARASSPRRRRRSPSAPRRSRCRRVGCASTCTATRCGAATRTTTPDEIAAAVVECGHRRAVHHRPQRDQGRGRPRRSAVVPRDRRRGAAHPRRRDHRPVPRPSGSRSACQPDDAARAIRDAGRGRLHPAPVRPDAPQPRRAGARRADRRRAWSMRSR